MYGPHFSAGFLCRRITYLEDQLKLLPIGCMHMRNNFQYVKIKYPHSSYIEKSINSPEGKKYSFLIAKRRKIINELQFFKSVYNKYYHGLAIIPQPEITRYSPIPESLTLDYYENPPELTNPHKIETPYISSDKILRSRFELIATETINELGLEFKNEMPIITPTGTYFMDIVIPVYERGRCVGFEFCGKAEDQNYVNRLNIKSLSYTSVGIIPNRDVIFIYGGEKWLPSVEQLKSAIIFGIENC